MLEFVKTTDGSVTLFNPGLQEHYHSVNGAITEAKHVYIQAGLEAVISRHPRINLLEVGFGTGLNALITALDVADREVKVNYIGVEAFPLDSDIINNLNYAELLNHPRAKEYFNAIHAVQWNQPFFIHDNFILNKLHAKIEEIHLQPGMFNLIYFDAFAPDKQSDIWSPAIFEKLFNCLTEEGVLVTYSSKGTVKQVLRAAGFSVERFPGPLGKRHMLRATKSKKEA